MKDTKGKFPFAGVEWGGRRKPSWRGLFGHLHCLKSVGWVTSLWAWLVAVDEWLVLLRG